MNKNEKGSVNIILAIAVVILAGVLGYVVFTGTPGFLTDQMTSTPSPSQTTSTVGTPLASTPTPSKAVSYITVTQWNVQFQTPSEMNDLQYRIENDDGGGAAFFTTNKLLNSNDGQGCTYGSIGVLTRVPNFDEFTKVGRSIPVSVHIGNYYYSFTGPQDVCSQNKETQQLVSAQIGALRSTVLETLRAAR